MRPNRLQKRYLDGIDRWTHINNFAYTRTRWTYHVLLDLLGTTPKWMTMCRCVCWYKVLMMDTPKHQIPTFRPRDVASSTDKSDNHWFSKTGFSRPEWILPSDFHEKNNILPCGFHENESLWYWTFVRMITMGSQKLISVALNEYFLVISTKRIIFTSLWFPRECIYSLWLMNFCQIESIWIPGLRTSKARVHELFPTSFVMVSNNFQWHSLQMWWWYAIAHLTVLNQCLLELTTIPIARHVFHKLTPLVQCKSAMGKMLCLQHGAWHAYLIGSFMCIHWCHHWCL